MDRLDCSRMFIAILELGSFAAAGYGLCTGNQRRVRDYALLNCYLKGMLSVSGAHERVNIAPIKQGYYSIKALNPNGIVPTGSDMSEYGF